MVLLQSRLATIVHALQGVADKGQVVLEMEMENTSVKNRTEPKVAGVVPQID